LSEAQRPFWTSRLNEVGHTGWRDPVLNAYDQVERLAVVSDAIASYGPVSGTALDFGSGVGDFSSMLLSRGFQVWGYDPFVHTQNANPNFHYVDTSANLRVLKVEFDLILSVTVLDHIVDDSEFFAELAGLRALVSPKGTLIMVEYALDQTVDRKASYQAFRSLESWRMSLDRSGWQLCTSQSVSHPDDAPSRGYVLFLESTVVRILRRLSRHHFMTARIQRAVLRRYARRVLRKTGFGRPASSPLKLMVCKPK
jgi:hypothetical protein